MAFTGIAKYCQLLRKAAIGVTTGDGPFDLTLNENRVQVGMIDFEDDESFFDDIPVNGPFLKIVFPTTTGNANVTAHSAQKLYQIDASLYVSLLQPRSDNFLLDPNDFTEAAWINSPYNVATAHKITDPTTLEISYIYQSLEVENDSTVYQLSAYFRKTSGATIFPGLGLAFLGDTCATPVNIIVALNTNTGVAEQVSGDNDTTSDITISVTTPTDVSDGYWKLTISLNNNSSGNTVLDAQIFSAVCGADFVAHASLENQVDVYFPVLTQPDAISRNILDYSYILQLLNNLNSAWIDSGNFISCGVTYPGVDDFRSEDLVAPIDGKPDIGVIPIVVTHRSVC